MDYTKASWRGPGPGNTSDVETEEDLRQMIAELREEAALLRGVLDILRVDLQIKDDQIDKLYQSLRTMRSYPQSPPMRPHVSTSSTSSASTSPLPKRSVKETQKCSQRNSNNPAASGQTTLLTEVLSDDLVALIIAFLDVSSNIGARRTCKKFNEISRTSMIKYWTKAWNAVKGSVPTTSNVLSSSAAWKQEFRWFQLGSRPIVTTLTGHKGSVTSLAFADSNDRELLVSGSDDGSLIVWCTSEERQRDEDSRPVIMQHHHRQSKGENVSRLHSLNGHHGPVWGVSVDGGTVCSGSFDKTIKLWELSSGNCLHTIRGHENWVSCVSLKDDTILSGSWDSTVRIWRVGESQVRHMGNMPTEAGNAVYALDRCGGVMATGSHMKRVEAFDIETRQLLRRYDEAHAAKTYAIHFQSKDVFASAGCDGKARLWDLRESTSTPHIDVAAHDKPVFVVRLGDALSSPFRMATSSMDYLVKIFDLRMANKSIEEIPSWVNLRGKRATGQMTLPAHSGSVFALCMDESKICSGSADGTIRVFRF